MTTIDNNPEILTSLLAPIGRGVEELGRGVGDGVRGLGHRPSGGPPPVETAYAATYDEPVRPYDTEEQAVKERGGD